MIGSAITDVSPVLKKAVKDGLILDGEGLYDAPVALFYDLDLWDAHIAKCNEAFGNTFRHMVAMKSNPLSKFIKRIYEVHGFGVECASIGKFLENGNTFNNLHPRIEGTIDNLKIKNASVLIS